MSDEITQTESAETLETSQVDQTQEGTNSEAEDVIEESSTQVELPPEAKEWAELSGSTQDRIVELVRRAKRAEEQASNSYALQTPAPVYPSEQESVDMAEVQKAIKILRKNGIPTMEDVRNEISRLETQAIHEKLSSKYDGSDGSPRYIPEEVEDYARRNQIWNLESAYRTMYFDELMDNAKRGNKRKPVASEKPSARILQEDTSSSDSIRAKLRNKDGSLNLSAYEELAKDPQKFDALLRSLT